VRHYHINRQEDALLGFLLIPLSAYIRLARFCNAPGRYLIFYDPVSRIPYNFFCPIHIIRRFCINQSVSVAYLEDLSNLALLALAGRKLHSPSTVDIFPDGPTCEKKVFAAGADGMAASLPLIIRMFGFCSSGLNTD
jgi:hypothetical protein